MQLACLVLHCLFWRLSLPYSVDSIKRTVRLIEIFEIQAKKDAKIQAIQAKKDFDILAKKNFEIPKFIFLEIFQYTVH